MDESLPARRMAENEVVFRKYNERVQQGFDEMKKIAKQAGQEHLVRENDTPLYFYCECSDENCLKRIRLTPAKYAELHKERDHFVILHNHETTRIERVIKKAKEYVVVKKHNMPSSSASRLSQTDVDNS